MAVEVKLDVREVVGDVVALLVLVDVALVLGDVDSVVVGVEKWQFWNVESL